MPPLPNTVPKIYAFVSGQFGGGDVSVVALAEDGDVIASHISSNASWAQNDIGATSDRQHDRYKTRYPDGYELVWVDEPDTHDGVTAARARAEETADAN